MKNITTIIFLMLMLMLISGQTFDPNNRSPRISLNPGNTIATDNHPGCSEANLNLGNGWTLVDCNAISNNAPPSITLSLVHGQAVPAHSTIVLLFDADQAGTDLSGTVSCGDNAGNTFTLAPMGYSPPFNNAGSDNHLIFLGYWYVLDSNAKASGYQATCTFTPIAADIDMSVMVFKQDSGLPSSGVDAYIAWDVGNTASGTCPCEAVPGGQTITVSHARDLILGGGNQNSGFPKLDAPFVGADGDNSYFGPAYYTAAYTNNAPGQSPILHWYTTAPNIARSSTMFALLPSN